MKRHLSQLHFQKATSPNAGLIWHPSVMEVNTASLVIPRQGAGILETSRSWLHIACRSLAQRLSRHFPE